MRKPTFDSLVGREFDFYGAHGTLFRIDDMVWRVECRHSSDGLAVHTVPVESAPLSLMRFSPAPLSRVKVIIAESDMPEHPITGYRLVDGDRRWLLWGIGDEGMGDRRFVFVFDGF